MKKHLWLLGLCFLLAGCGPLIGLGSKMSDGIGKVAVKGEAASIKGGGELLVFAPFAKTDQAFYICRGEEARNFADELQRQQLFSTSYYMEQDPAQEAATAKRLHTLSATEIKTQLGLQRAPKLILFGTLLLREETAIPLRGVVMETVYRLEFYDVAAKSSTTFEIEGHFLAEEMVGEIVAELGRRIGG